MDADTLKRELQPLGLRLLLEFNLEVVPRFAGQGNQTQSPKTYFFLGQFVPFNG